MIISIESKKLDIVVTTQCIDVDAWVVGRSRSTIFIQFGSSV